MSSSNPQLLALPIAFVVVASCKDDDDNPQFLSKGASITGLGDVRAGSLTKFYDAVSERIFTKAPDITSVCFVYPEAKSPNHAQHHVQRSSAPTNPAPASVPA